MHCQGILDDTPHDCSQSSSVIIHERGPCINSGKHHGISDSKSEGSGSGKEYDSVNLFPDSTGSTWNKRLCTRTQ
jgi:hypothetical protein